MDKLVSVIVIGNDDYSYFVRCVNSIKRQSYKSIEITVVIDEGFKGVVSEEILQDVDMKYNDDLITGVNEAMNEAKGELVLLCNITAVLAGNYIQQMVGTDRTFWGGNYLAQQNRQYEMNERLNLLPYGKLFSKQVLQEHQLNIEGNCSYSYELFTMEYMNFVDDLEFCHQAYSYDCNNNLLHYNEISSTDLLHWDRFCHALAKTVERKYCAIPLTLLENLNPNITTQEEVVLINQVLECFRENIELAYSIEKLYITKWIKQINDDTDEYLFNGTMQFFRVFDEEKDIQKILLQEVNWSEEFYELIKNIEIDKYLFFVKNYRCQITNDLVQYDDSEMIKDMSKKIESITEELSKISKNQNKMVRTPVEHYQAQVVNVRNIPSAQLAEVFVERSIIGQMGIKMIIQALLGWIKYKIKRGRS